MTANTTFILTFYILFIVDFCITLEYLQYCIEVLFVMITSIFDTLLNVVPAHSLLVVIPALASFHLDA